jgi:phage terminase small subunit
VALSERQRLFVEAYMGEAKGNATQAAVLAGYAESGAAEQGRRLLRNDDVREAIDSRAEGDPRVMGREELQRFWTSVARGEEEDAKMADRLKASEYLGKTKALFVTKHEHRGVAGVTLYLPDNGRNPK